MAFSSFGLVKGANPYTLYVLGLLLIAYLLNQLDRYTLAIVTKPMAQEIHYGKLGCMNNDSVISKSVAVKCANIENQTSCEDALEDDVAVCKWDYTGQGFDYQILAGPVFILIYTFSGIPVSLAADLYNRKVLLAISVIFWSSCTILTGFVNDYWQLVILRLGLGLGQSGFGPCATTLISDYFAEQLRGAALGVYNMGIYIGYSMSFALGNYITTADINGQGWRWTFIIAGLPGIFLSMLIMLTVKEPRKSTKTTTKNSVENGDDEEKFSKTSIVFESFCRPSVLLLCLAGSIRNAAGYVWGYNVQLYFESIGESNSDIAAWLSWIPMVGGSIGVLVGGFISDRFVVKSGPHGRIWVLIVSQVLAAPFAAGCLLLPTPYAYISLLPTYIIGEMWVGVTLAVLVELVPARIKTTSVAVYFFIISNIGGNMPVFVTILTNFFHRFTTNVKASRYALLCLYPGEYLLGSILFLTTLFVLKRDLAYIQSLGSPRGSKADIVQNINKSQLEQSNSNESEQSSSTKM